MPTVVPDVAIVTHNTDYYLLNLLDSLEPMRARGVVGHVHVWDNASSDHTAALLSAYTAINPWVRARRSATNLHHGPALDRLLRESCQRDWVLVLDADTEVQRSFEAALCRDDLAEAAFVGQIHPQMPQLYAYLAHLLVHRPRYLELPRFRHHGAPGIDYFRAVEIERRPYVRFRWCDYVHHFGQGALRRIVEREDRDNEFYDFARAQEARHPRSADHRTHELALQENLHAFLSRRGHGPRRGREGHEGDEGHACPPPFDKLRAAPSNVEGPKLAQSAGERRREGPRAVRNQPKGSGAFPWLLSPRRARALAAARRMGLKQRLSEVADLMRMVDQLRPRRVIEIGTAHGGSFLLWARAAAADATLISIDVPPWEIDDPGDIDKRRAIERVGSRQQSVHLLRGNSHDPEVQARAKACLRGEPVDFLFIDSDHSYEGVKRDFQDYASMVRPGGIVAVHEIQRHSRGWGGEVPRFWREIRERYRHVELIANRRQDGFGIGVVWI